MKLNLITFASSLASRESIFTDHHELLDAIAERYDVRYIFPEELGDKPAEGATMVLVGSGGVEEMVKADIDRLPPYVVLIADGLKNSLAASLEILSWMRQGRHRQAVGMAHRQQCGLPGHARALGHRDGGCAPQRSGQGL